MSRNKNRSIRKNRYINTYLKGLQLCAAKMLEELKELTEYELFKKQELYSNMFISILKCQGNVTRKAMLAKAYLTLYYKYLLDIDEEEQQFLRLKNGKKRGGGNPIYVLRNGMSMLIDEDYMMQGDVPLQLDTNGQIAVQAANYMCGDIRSQQLVSGEQSTNRVLRCLGYSTDYERLTSMDSEILLVRKKIELAEQNAILSATQQREAAVNNRTTWAEISADASCGVACCCATMAPFIITGYTASIATDSVRTAVRDTTQYVRDVVGETVNEGSRYITAPLSNVASQVASQVAFQFTWLFGNAAPMSASNATSTLEENIANTTSAESATQANNTFNETVNILTHSSQQLSSYLDEVLEAGLSLNPKVVVLGLVCGVGAFCAAHAYRRRNMDRLREKLVLGAHTSQELDRIRNQQRINTASGVLNIGRVSAALAANVGGPAVAAGAAGVMGALSMVEQRIKGNEEQPLNLNQFVSSQDNGRQYALQSNRYAHEGYPPQGYPPQGYPPQGYPPQGYPPQGYPPQGYPNEVSDGLRQRHASRRNFGRHSSGTRHRRRNSSSSSSGSQETRRRNSRSSSSGSGEKTRRHKPKKHR
jgi:hypothetical protein